MCILVQVKDKSNKKKPKFICCDELSFRVRQYINF